MKRFIILSIAITTYIIIFIGCSGSAMQNFMEGAAKGARIAMEAQLEAEKEIQKQRRQRNAILRQRDAIIRSRIQLLGAPVIVEPSPDGKYIGYVWDQITLGKVIQVLGTPDKSYQQEGITAYRWGSYFFARHPEIEDVIICAQYIR